MKFGGLMVRRLYFTGSSRIMEGAFQRVSKIIIGEWRPYLLITFFNQAREIFSPFINKD
jgi:hypothetical protein